MYSLPSTLGLSSSVVKGEFEVPPSQTGPYSPSGWSHWPTPCRNKRLMHFSADFAPGNSFWRKLKTEFYLSRSVLGIWEMEKLRDLQFPHTSPGNWVLHYSLNFPTYGHTDRATSTLQNMNPIDLYIFIDIHIY